MSFDNEQASTGTAVSSALLTMLATCLDVYSGYFRTQDVSSTQYLLMLLVLDARTDRVALSELAKRAELTPNAAAQATGALERLGLMEKSVDARDSRARLVALTPAASERVASMEAEMSDLMTRRFNPGGDSDYYRILKRGLHDGYVRGFLWYDDYLVERYPTSTSLAALDFTMRRFKAVLADEAGVSLSEARILQRLAEVGEPMRVVDLARQLSLQMATVTRATKHLEERGVLERLRSAENLQAVFLDVTQAGAAEQARIVGLIDREGDQLIWGEGDADHRALDDRISQAFHAEAQRLDRERHAKLLASLQK